MTAQRTQRLQISYRAQGGIDDFFHHGIYYRCECTPLILMCLSDPNSSKASVLSQSGGTCVCTSTTDPTCATDDDYNLCVIGRCTECPNDEIGLIIDSTRHQPRSDHCNGRHCRTRFLYVWFPYQSACRLSVRLSPTRYISSANPSKPGHGIECIFYISSGWLSRYWQCFLRTSTHCRLCRRLHFRVSFIDWHATMAGQSHTCFSQSRQRRWYWYVSYNDRTFVFSWHWSYYRLCCDPYRLRRMSSTVSRRYWGLHWSQIGKPYGKAISSA